MRSRVTTLFAVILLSSAAPSALAVTPDADAVRVAIEERQAYGLDASQAYVASLIGSASDVGSGSVGIAATVEELKALDLDARSAFVRAAERDLLPYARAQAGFSGAWQDQRHLGRLMLAFTALSDSLRDGLAMRTPAGPGIELTQAKSTLSQLESSEIRVWTLWPLIVPGVTLRTVAVDERANRLEIGVSPTTVAAATASTEAIEAQLGVDISFVASEKSTEQSCVAIGREPCYSPSKAGTVVHNGTPTGSRCTMSFHVVKSGNDMWLTAGHCGWAAGNDWYLKGYPNALLKQDSEYDHDLGQDALLVEFPNDQDSTAIYDSTRRVTGSRNPVQGETICASLGVTDQDALGPGWDCGTVRAASLSWVGGNGLIMRGADLDGIAGHSGDSGSPMVDSPRSGDYVALGIWNLADGGFAKAQNVMDAFGVTINLSS